jgi:hypothetical protein
VRGEGDVGGWSLFFVLEVMESKHREDVVSGSGGIIRVITVKKEIAIPTCYDIGEVRG